jgi:hypothetical protein
MQSAIKEILYNARWTPEDFCIMGYSLASSALL